MSNTYKIGNSQGQISLEVNIVSVALAATQASVLVVSSADPSTPVANSTNATGNIPQQPIGDQTLLGGKRLSVFTKVTLPGDDAAARAAQAPNVTGIYTLSGGDDGVKTYNNPVSTYNDPNVFLLFVTDFL